MESLCGDPPMPLCPARVIFINVDTTIYLERPPEGTWLAFRESFAADSDGG